MGGYGGESRDLIILLPLFLKKSPETLLQNTENWNFKNWVNSPEFNNEKNVVIPTKISKARKLHCFAVTGD